jgi:hypothetical protein
MPNHCAAEIGQGGAIGNQRGCGEGEGNGIFLENVALSGGAAHPAGKDNRESEPERQAAFHHVFHEFHISGDPERAAIVIERLAVWQVRCI